MGRRWNPEQHPRHPDGRFRARGLTGKVRRLLDAGDIEGANRTHLRSVSDAHEENIAWRRRELDRISRMPEGPARSQREATVHHKYHATANQIVEDHRPLRDEIIAARTPAPGWARQVNDRLPGRAESGRRGRARDVSPADVADNSDQYVGTHEAQDPATGDWGAIQEVYQDDSFDGDLWGDGDGGDEGPTFVVSTSEGSFTISGDDTLAVRPIRGR